jgi:hypothetical protein
MEAAADSIVGTQLQMSVLFCFCCVRTVFTQAKVVSQGTRHKAIFVKENI